MSDQSKYTPELAADICKRLSNGETLSSICRLDGYPCRSTFHAWRDSHDDLNKTYLIAKRDGHDAIAERARATARGYDDLKGGDSTGDVQRDKLIIETDLKLLAKWDSGRYGERTVLAGDPEAPLRGLSDEELDAKIAAKVQALGVNNG